jgi:hypothetical protein
VRLILDGTVVRMRLDRKATSISLLVVMGVRADGQKSARCCASSGVSAPPASHQRVRHRRSAAMRFARALALCRGCSGRGGPYGDRLAWCQYAKAPLMVRKLPRGPCPLSAFPWPSLVERGCDGPYSYAGRVLLRWH